MTALTDAAQTASASAVPARMPMLGTLRLLLLAEAALTLGLAVAFSVLAASVLGTTDETNLRFAAGGAFLFAIFAAIAARGVRRRRGWAWTMAAILQVLLAIGTSIAVMTAAWHPGYLVGFAFATLVMLVLSSASVRKALGQL